MKVTLYKPDDTGRCRIQTDLPTNLFVALDGRDHPFWVADGPSDHPIETAWTGKSGYSEKIMDAVSGFVDGTMTQADAERIVAEQLALWLVQRPDAKS